MNIQKILKIIGYVVFGLLVFIFFTYLHFPFHKLKDKIFNAIEKQSGFVIDAGDLRPTWTFGVVLDDVKINHISRSLPPLKLTQLDIAPSLLSLMIFKPKINFRLGFGDGSINGYFQTQGTHTQRIKLDLHEIHIHNSDLKKATNLDLSGVLRGEIDLRGNFQRLGTIEGISTINIQDFSLGKMTVLNMGLPELKLSHIILNGQIKNERFVIEKFDLGAPTEDLQATAKGDILLNSRNMGNSRLNVKVRFKLSQKLKDEFALFLPFIASALNASDDFYSIHLTGTLSAPMATPQR